MWERIEEQRSDGPPPQFSFGKLQQLLRRAIYERDAAIQAGTVNPGQVPLEQRPIALLALPQRFLGFFAFGDVLGHREQTRLVANSNDFCRQEPDAQSPRFRPQRDFNVANCGLVRQHLQNSRLLLRLPPKLELP